MTLMKLTATMKMTRSLWLRMMWTKNLQATAKKVARMVLMRMMISAGAFTSDAIGAGHGQLQQVTPCGLYNFLVVQTNILLSCQIFCTFVSIPRRSDGSCSYEISD
jgi:hypothetical protein